MPIYEYEDKTTGHRCTVTTQSGKQRMDNQVSRGIFRRIFSFTTSTPFTAINPEDPRAQPITSKFRYKSELSRMSEEHSARHNGMDVDYQPVDVRDPQSLGVSDVGIEAAARKAHDSGTRLAPIKHFT